MSPSEPSGDTPWWENTPWPLSDAQKAVLARLRRAGGGSVTGFDRDKARDVLDRTYGPAPDGYADGVLDLLAACYQPDPEGGGVPPLRLNRQAAWRVILYWWDRAQKNQDINGKMFLDDLEDCVAIDLRVREAEARLTAIAALCDERTDSSPRSEKETHEHRPE